MLFETGLLQVKDRQGIVMPYVRSPMQRDFAERRAVVRPGKRGNIIVKARQMGVTTDITYEQVSKVLTIPYYSAYMIAYNADDVKYIFDEKVRFAFNNLPEVIRESYMLTKDNTKQLQVEKFGSTDMYSSISVGVSARSKTVQFLHVSEAGVIAQNEKKWREVIEGSFPAAQEILIESTAKGYNGFHDLVMDNLDGLGEFDVHFYNWAWEESYRTEPPLSKAWIEDYNLVAKKYNLVADPMSEHGIDLKQFYFYYLKSRTFKDGTKSEYPFTIEEAFEGSNMSVFSQGVLAELLRTAKNQTYTEKNGFKVWHEPVEGMEYMLGVDPEEGDGADSASITVRERDTYRQMAQWRGKAKPVEIASKAVWSARYFNEGLIACERNGNGLAAVERLEETGYKNLFKADQARPGTTEDNAKEGVKIGWNTSSNTRPTMIFDFVEAIDEGILEVNSIDEIREMFTFVRKENGRIEHDTGKHDDILFSDFICYQMRKYKPTDVSKYFSFA